LDAARIEEVQCSDVIWVTLGEKGGGYAIESGSGAVMITGWVADPAGLFCWLEASPGGVAPTFSGRKAVAGAPMCEQ
jgi:hypothetical protein